MLSIVIPIYKAENTLNRCVESVVNQSFSDFELILVDDGSPDACPRLCDNWATKDKRIRVVHKANGGLSDARNRGISVASGDYITFIDADDYIADETLGLLVEACDKHPDSDIIEYPISRFHHSSKQSLLTFKPKTWTDMETYWVENEAYDHSYTPNKVYRRELFDKVRFPVGVVFEDANTLPKLLQYCRAITTVDKGCYYYCYNPEGITATADGDELRMLLQPHAKWLSQHSFNTPAYQRYYMRALNIQMDVYELTGDAPILPVAHLNPSNFKGKEKLKAIALNILGIKGLCKLNKLVHHLWRNH